MNIGNVAELAIRKQLITWVLTVLLLVGGFLAFQSMARLEDPEFTIKEALILTPYPGASAAEVEEEVTSVIEEACQKMGSLWFIEPRSQRDLSIVERTAAWISAATILPPNFPDDLFLPQRDSATNSLRPLGTGLETNRTGVNRQTARV